jgi:hypothetical protein
MMSDFMMSDFFNSGFLYLVFSLSIFSFSFWVTGICPLLNIVASHSSTESILLSDVWTMMKMIF